MRELFLKKPLMPGWVPTYGDLICYPKTSIDREGTDGVGICHCAEEKYALLWIFEKGGPRKLSFYLKDCRPVTQDEYPRTEKNVQLYRFYDRLMDVNLQTGA